MTRPGLNAEDVVSYFIRYNFLNKENRDVVNAVYIANKLLEIREYPFKNNDFEQEENTLRSKRIERILEKYHKVGSLVNRTSKNPWKEDHVRLAKTAEYLSGFSSKKLGDVARYMYSPEDNKDIEEYSKETIRAIKLSLGIKL